ncbi:MAG: flagellar hook assembly protein FlgD [Sulfurimicrobium sp.]|jgi:flagellar basal-body rod modification protein FlgD|nr:flagellar hook assembly protein FlgD [Sulfurimicrobium sp.]
MTTVNAASSSTATTSPSRTAAQESEDRFLKLLVTQMQNQDPLNPLDNAEVTSQMAQLSTVTGINQLNDAVKAISESFLAGQSLQAASLIGHGVMIPGKRLELANGVAYGGVDLPQAVDKLSLNVKDASGAVVYTTDLGAQNAAGTIPFQWDGVTDSGSAAPDGAYTFEVAAEQGGKKVDVAALEVGQVASVSLGLQGATLNVIGLGPVAMSQVKQIL